ncbi:ACP phosphodiesterase [Flavobacteriaceae bacterium]|nr:ACP phosphodiesterase [Flavobacteriaceae bacterium]
MNFLAHLYLANTDKEVMIGNFIADSIVGNKFDHFSPKIQQGIKMHRKIDEFTDNHPIFRQSKRRLDEKYRLYKGVIIDILYDHMLAKNWSNYSNIPLNTFSKGVYTLLEDNFDILPKKTQHLLPYMKSQNWLYSYRTEFGIASILHDMNVRTKGISKMNESINDLQNNRIEFEDDFELFFKDITQFCTNYLENYER